MRRRVRLLSVVVVLAAPLALSACSGGGVDVDVSGDFGRLPQVRFPKGEPGDSFAVKTVKEGKDGGAQG